MTATMSLGAGLATRFLLRSQALQQALQDRIEITTPISSWKRLREGLFLLRSSQDPYAGGVFHQAPLLLMLFDLADPAYPWLVDALFTLADALTAYMMFRIARMQKASNKESAAISPALTAALYLLHPFLAATSLARCTLTFSHLATVASLFHAMQGQSLASMLTLSIATHLSLYPFLLLPPIAMLFAQHRNRPISISLFVSSSIQFIVCSTALSLLSRWFTGSWSFFNFYQVILAVTDLTPNVGLCWYFFIEMFDHFRPFFLGVFQLHILSYVAPLCLKLSDAPLLVITLLLGLIATFKSYPSVGDIALFHVMLSLFPERLTHMRTPLVAIGMVAYCICLMPAFHHLWLYAGSGNANFYYATTLVLGTGNSFLIADTLFSHLRYEFGKKHSVKHDMQVVQR